MIELRILGALELVGGDGSSLISVLAQPRRAALLCYLALESRHGFRRRDLLYATFWPEFDARQARHALRQSLYFLRRALGPEAIASRGDDDLAVNSQTVRCDACEFQELVDRDALKEALPIYRGDLLPGFHIDNAPEFERWLDDERARLRAVAARAAGAFAESHERDGDVTGAALWLRRAVLLSPGDETVVRRLLLLLQRHGDFAGAIAAYDSFVQELARDYELEPSAPTRDLIAKIRGDGSRAVSSQSAALEPMTLPATSTAVGSSAAEMAPPRSEAGRRLRVRHLAAAASLVLEALDDALAAGTAPTTTSSPSAPAKSNEKPVVAVLPLTNMSASADDEYFADGMTEDIIAQLSQIASLKVISRTSVMRFKNSDKSITDIANELGATHLIEGSVRRAGNRLRIVTQLREVADEVQLWGETFDRDIADVFAIQSEVAARVTDRIRTRVTAEEKSRLERRPTKDIEAYNDFLLGRHHWNRAGHPGAIESAVECYSRAIARDPGFARAHGMLGQVYTWHGGGYFGMHPRDAGELIHRHASRALELDPDSIEAEYCLAYLALWHQYDVQTAAKHIAKGLALNPNASDLHVVDAHRKLYEGDALGAIEADNRACEVDPASFLTRGNRICIILWAGRIDDALVSLQDTEAALGDDFFLSWVRLFVMQALGRTAEIVDHLAEWRRLVPIPLADINYGIALASAGDVAAAREVLASLEHRARSEYIWPTGLAWLYAECGDMDRAFETLSRACDDRAGVMNFLLCSQQFDRFRDDPRFDAIAKRIGATAPPGWRPARPPAIQLASQSKSAASQVRTRPRVN